MGLFIRRFGNHTLHNFYDLLSKQHAEKSQHRSKNMLSWGEVRRSFGLSTEQEPVIREKRGRKVVFWFRSDGNGTVADMITRIRSKGVPVEIVWDEKEELVGICIEKRVLLS